jgi:hypothetical protein
MRFKISSVPADAANSFLCNMKLLKGFQRTSIYPKKIELRWYAVLTMEETEEHDTHFICLSRDITKVKLVDESLAK